MKMDKSVLEWLMEESAHEVRLRMLKEYEKLSDDDESIVACKKELLRSKVYDRALKKLKKDKPWDKYDAILAFAEWGLTRDDIGNDIDDEVYALIESTGFKMLCGEPLLLRNLVKLGYYTEDIVKNEIDMVLANIKDDGGFGCISTNKKINDPKKPHKSYARLTVEYLLLAAELSQKGYKPDCADALVHYFTNRTATGDTAPNASGSCSGSRRRTTRFPACTEAASKKTSLPPGPWKRAAWCSMARKKMEIRCSGFAQKHIELGGNKLGR